MGSQLHQSAMATPCLKSSVPSMSDGMIVECELKIESVEIVLTKSPFLAAAKKGGRHTLGIAIDYALQHNSLSHLFIRRKMLLAATISAHFGFQLTRQHNTFSIIFEPSRKVSSRKVRG